MLKSPIRLLAVGCGAFALRHARSCGPIAEKFPDLFRIVGACDVDKASGELYSTKIAAFQTDVGAHIHRPVEGFAGTAA